MRKRTFALQTACAATVALLGVSVAQAVVFPESEPNDTKATANVVGPMTAGDSIVGNSILATGVGVDYFDVTLSPLPLGIYQHRLVITSPTVGHSATIRGLGQTAAPPDTQPGIPWDGVVGAANTTESSIQSTSTVTTPPRYNQWYGFGRSGRFHYRVTGVAATTADYTSTLETVAVTPVNIGNYNPGPITISTFNQGHSSDTDMWVYDSGLNPIRGYGNDDESTLGGTPGTGATLQSWLARDFTAGTYYLAMSTFQMALNSPSPSDDDFRTGSLMEFPDIVVNSSTATNVNTTFTISDGVNTLQVPNAHVNAFDVNWFQFTVVPEPATLGLFTLALPMLMRRRRA